MGSVTNPNQLGLGDKPAHFDLEVNVAHIAKFKAHAAGQLGAHVDRLRGDDQRYGNSNIDPSRSGLNYDLSGCVTPFVQMVAEAKRDAPKTVRKDAVMLAAYCVTLPKDWPQGRDPKEFFDAVRAFDLRFVPESWREVRATVHLDETTPHLHHVFVPLDGTGQPNYNGTYKRSSYKRYHTDLQKWVCDTLKLDTLHILLDDDDVAGKALSGLSQSDYVKAKQAEERAVEEARRAEEAVARAQSRERVAVREAAESEREAAEAAQRAKVAQESREAEERARKAAEEAKRRALRERDIIAGDKRYRVEGVTHLGNAALKAQRDSLEAEVSRLEARKADLDGLEAEVRSLEAQKDELVRELSEVRLEADAERARLYELRAKVDQLRAYVKDFLADVWRTILEAWADHGPWAEEQDHAELTAAVEEVSHTWNVPIR